VTRTESHSWPRAASPWARLMRLARSQPERPGKRLLPAAVVWAPRNLPGTGPSGHPHPQGRKRRRQCDRAGRDGSPKAGSQPAGRWPGRRSIVRGLPRVCEVDAVDEDPE